MFKLFPVEYQMDSQDCGPASLKIIAKYFGKYYSLQYLRDQCGIRREGVSMLDLSTGNQMHNRRYSKQGSFSSDRILER